MLQVSSNQQQYTTTSLVYVYYPHPIVEQLTPPIGPTAGGTLVRVYGKQLYGRANSVRSCRLGTEGVSVPATFDPVT